MRPAKRKPRIVWEQQASGWYYATKLGTITHESAATAALWGLKAGWVLWPADLSDPRGGYATLQAAQRAARRHA